VTLPVRIAAVPTVQVTDETPIPAARVLEAARDFTERRAEMWPDVHVEHLEVHEAGETFADVTEGNPWPIGHVWERLRYDWSEPGSVKGTVIDSNLFKPGSTWEIRATSTNGGSRVELIGVRRLRGFKGWLIAPVFPLGLAKRTVADHLRHFLSRLEQQEAEPG
jgi:Polyketide cyclase / dehydrase and lipid transport